MEEDGRVTVLVPWSPATFAGTVKIVPKSRVRLLETSLADFTRVLGNMGVGAKELVPVSDG